MSAARAGVALLLGSALVLGCEPSPPAIPPSALFAAEARAEELEGRLREAEARQRAEAERVEELLKEVRAARELMSGRESEAIERAHEERVMLRSASAEVDALLHGSGLKQALRTSSARGAAEALERLEALPPRPFANLAAVHEAQVTLLRTIPLLLADRKAEAKLEATKAERAQSEVEDLRRMQTRAEDQGLLLARTIDQVARRLRAAREGLEEIAKTGDVASQARAKAALAASVDKE